ALLCREFSHWEKCMNCAMPWAGGWPGVPASLGSSAVLLWSEPGNLLSLWPLGGEFLLLCTLETTNLRSNLDQGTCFSLKNRASSIHLLEVKILGAFCMGSDNAKS
uniref:Uncharacterized protein n=1 Tax=Geospiza parvula TaxID=87175 RepID=A0A8C3QB38_GEOPR